MHQIAHADGRRYLTMDDELTRLSAQEDPAGLVRDLDCAVIDESLMKRPPCRPICTLRGGYPEMQQRTTTARRQAWARACMTTLVERDIRDIAQLDQVRQPPHLLAVAAELCGLLEKLYLVHRLPAWSRNGLSRLVKTPKLNFLDAGLQSALTRLSADNLLTRRARVSASNFKGLQRLRDAAGSQFVGGVLLCDGDHALPFGDGLWAVPLSRL